MRVYTCASVKVSMRSAGERGIMGRIHRRPWLLLNMDTPEKKPASSTANRARVTDSPTTSLEHREARHGGRGAHMLHNRDEETQSYCVSWALNSSWVKSRGRQARTLLSWNRERQKHTDWKN